MARILRTALVALACIGAWLPAARAADVRAWLDRDTVQLGETVALNIEATGTGASAPSFDALKNDFEVMDPSSSSSVNIVNGQATAKQLWGVSLQPRRVGRLTVPALAVAGATTQPLSLNVTAAPAATSGNEEIIVELSADPLTPYVQQQVSLTVKVYVAVNLSDYELEPLQAQGLVIQKLGQGRAYDAERGGRRFRVLEQRYAGLPEKSGTIELPPLKFRGRAISGNDPSAMFFGRGRMVSTQSQGVTLDVKPRPPQSGDGPWLPAQTLELSAAGIDASAGGRVGEPLTLTLTARAQGLGFEQIPELALPAIDGAEIYPDKPTTRTRDNGTWIFGERSRKFAIVPTRPGTLHIPAITLDWWDTAKDQPASAIVPAQDIVIAAGVAGAAAPAVPPAAADTPATTSPAPADAAPVSDAGPWRTLALASFALWLASVAIAFWWWRTRAGIARVATPTRTNDSTATLGSRGAFARAASGGDARKCARALLRWAQAEGIRATHLGELAAQLDSPAQRDAIEALQRACYAADGAGAVPSQTAAAFAPGFTRRSHVAASNDDAALPPLWPKSSRR
ncbi:BatD family protein [Tahibacter soli]|uniref:BatD family protein n=1 Tax=Tahibacter soli TaxID=2983605 RepID=A0A9X3YN35_9GAMM|nr:BatD family protein [Tahibacter soli]MDC8014732.1 BatD family protein [Tahibacter soli]